MGNLPIRLGKAVLTALAGVVASLIDVVTTSEVEDDDDRRLHDSDLMGEMNYRTGRLDSGTDPYGWYDDD